MTTARRADRRQTLTLVVPFYNEAANLPPLIDALDQFAMQAARRWSIEIDVFFIDDGSEDGGDEAIAARAAGHGLSMNVRLMRLSRNFGKEIALTAGLFNVRSDAVVLMDADLQHPIETVHDFIDGWLTEGYDVVYGYQQFDRPEGPFKSVARTVFYRLTRSTLSSPNQKTAGDFRLMSRKAYLALRRVGESQRLLKGLYNWIGFSQKGVPYKAAVRLAGESKYSPVQLLRLATQGVTSFSLAPLRLAIWSGLALALLASGYGVWTLFEKLFLGIPTPGYPTLIMLISMIGAAQLIFLGVLGEYLGKVLMEVKNRPLFLVDSDDLFTGRQGEGPPPSGQQGQ